MSRLRLMLTALLLGCALGLSHAETIQISTGEFPPWAGEKLPNGGFINRVVQEAFRRQGVQTELRYMPWARAMASLQHGNVIASSFWAHDAKRDQRLLQSAPLTNNPWLLFHRSELTLGKWRTLSDLAKYRFAVIRGYTYTTEFWDLIRRGVLKADIVQDDATALHELQAGLVDIVPMDPVNLAYLSSQPLPGINPNIRLEGDPAPFASLPAYLLIRDTPLGRQLLQRFNQGLASMQADGTLDTYRRELMDSLQAVHRNDQISQ
ncbi:MULTISPECIES: ABC transporter substrate-binding protein [unclassified Paludibacterium]|uniref:substrate-binding periplasmic protein n=1 Tax=unclassified Paludibacterium TaxID=2618429 RepID=UPI001C04DC3D|nr:transporter substrate-binding domain-containing protein [Paludibacterium sp. B53371]BEV71165.1 transporter substrate-binding domain-containing protein [Paludibacterium sp. THUN1379]